MTTLITKHITLNNQRTSIALEPVFWNALNHLARAEHDLTAAKKQVQMTKKMVARAMAK